MVLTKHNRFRHAFILLIAVMALALTSCQSEATGPAVASKPTQESMKSAATSSSAIDLKVAIAQVAKENIPAVVHIDVTERREISSPILPFSDDPFFHFFFKNPQMPRKFKQELKDL